MLSRFERFSIQMILLTSGLFGSLALSALSAVLPDIQAAYSHLPNAAFWTKAVVTIDGIAMMAAPFAGLAVARLGGPRRTLIVCYSIFLVAGVSGAFIANLFAIIAMRFFVGIAGAVLITLAVTLIFDRYEGRARELRFGWNHALGAILIGLFVPLAGWLGDTGGWRWAFAVHLVGLPFLLFAYVAKDLAQFRHERPVTNILKSSKSVLPLALLTLAAGSIALSIPIFMPFHVREIGVGAGTVSGTMFTLMTITSFLASASFGIVRRWLPTPAILVIAFSLWTTGLIIAGSAQTIQMIILGALVIGSGGGLVQPSLFSTIAAMSRPEEVLRNNGIIKMCFYGGPFVGTTLLQLFLGHLPAGVSLLAMGGLAFALAIGAGITLAAMRRSAAARLS